MPDWSKAKYRKQLHCCASFRSGSCAYGWLKIWIKPSSLVRKYWKFIWLSHLIEAHWNSIRLPCEALFYVDHIPKSFVWDFDGEIDFFLFPWLLSLTQFFSFREHCVQSSWFFRAGPYEKIWIFTCLFSFFHFSLALLWFYAIFIIPVFVFSKAFLPFDRPKS